MRQVFMEGNLHKDLLMEFPHFPQWADPLEFIWLLGKAQKVHRGTLPLHWLWPLAAWLWSCTPRDSYDHGNSRDHGVGGHHVEKIIQLQVV